ncbi:MAG TPA: hypothetical protein VFB45_14555 [Pseudolabrys sp.]|nr:hypothetical protein [Pseudolabrys sp.]
MTVLRNFVATVILVFVSAIGAAGADSFPLDRELLLDAQPMRPGKRIPSITVTTNGSVAIDLWCKSVGGRVELGENSIAIVPDALPEALPAWQSAGQCTPQRMQADESLLAAIAQATEWRRQGDAIVLSGGPAPLRFRGATN